MPFPLAIKSIRLTKAVAIIELAMALGIISFWIAFFSTDLVRIDDPVLREKYLAFESAFPLPDFYLSLVLIIGSIGLLTRKNFGFLFSLMGGASLIFLALLDFSFNFQHGLYCLGPEEAALNISINSLCFGAGLFIVLIIWKKYLSP